MAYKIQISPMLLKSVASLYSDPHRVIMEYIDNSVDAAENFYDKNTEAYSKQIDVLVTFDGTSYEYARIIIRDNCMGISNLSYLITKVGNSSKLKDDCTNGQFGFGIYSFLAVCDGMLIETRPANSDIINRAELRSEMFDNPESEGSTEIKEIQNISGFQIGEIKVDCWTVFRLERFHKQPFRELSPGKLKEQIENHFELILKRKNISVKVAVKGGKTYDCKPFNYDKYDGETYLKVLENLEKYNSKKYQSKTQIPLGSNKVSIFLKVSKGRVLNRKPVFVIKGRRITEISDVKAFRTSLKGQIWSHPNVTGYIDVSGVLEPKISRDDFKPGVLQKALFHTLSELEPEIKDFITRQLKLPASSEYKNLQEYLSKTLKKLSENRRFRSILKFEAGLNSSLSKGEDDEEAKEKITLNSPKRIKNPDSSDSGKEIYTSQLPGESRESTGSSPETPVNITSGSLEYELRKTTVEISSASKTDIKKYSKNANRLQSRIEGISIIIDSESTPPQDNNNRPLRSIMMNNQIIIYKKHPMFQERVRESNFGVQVINYELIFYLAMEIMTQFKAVIYSENKDSIADMNAFFNDYSEGIYLFVSELKSLEGKNLNEIL